MGEKPAARVANASTLDARPLLARYPRLAGTGWSALGLFPTRVECASELARGIAPEGNGELWLKRDDLSHPIYGGNKVRTLEILLGAARKHGATRVYSTGAFGSNHAVAALLHGARLGLQGGVVLYPQPVSMAARENLEWILSLDPDVVCLPHWSTLPVGIALARHAERKRGGLAEVMVPGGATPLGALAYVSAGLELAEQVARGECPAPRRIVVGVGSCCTSAGLLVGLHLAARLGVAFRDTLPQLHSVRVTPWPVTAAWRILDLAVRASQELAALSGDRALVCTREQLASKFRVETAFFGAGYGEPTESGLRAMEVWRRGAPDMVLDTTYSAKSAACVVRHLRAHAPGPTLYWATKSSARVPDSIAAGPGGVSRTAPMRMRRWLGSARTTHTSA